MIRYFFLMVLGFGEVKFVYFVSGSRKKGFRR